MQVCLQRSNQEQAYSALRQPLWDRHLASVQPLHGDGDIGGGAQIVSAIAADTAARLLAARFAASSASGATELTREIAAQAAVASALVSSPCQYHTLGVRSQVPYT